MMLLLLFYSFPPKVNVGTDIVHAVILTGVTGFLHFRLGNVDPKLVLSLLIGSIPGGLLGSHLSTRVPMLWLRRILCTLLLVTGARMLWPDHNNFHESKDLMTSLHTRIFLQRIEAALEAARVVFARFTPGAIETEYKIGHDPVTEADRAVDAVLRQNLLREAKDGFRKRASTTCRAFDKSRVWVVDPLDGTREFVQGFPNFAFRSDWSKTGASRRRHLQSSDE